MNCNVCYQRHIFTLFCHFRVKGVHPETPERVLRLMQPAHLPTFPSAGGLKPMKNRNRDAACGPGRSPAGGGGTARYCHPTMAVRLGSWLAGYVVSLPPAGIWDGFRKDWSYFRSPASDPTCFGVALTLMTSVMGPETGPSLISTGLIHLCQRFVQLRLPGIQHLPSQ